MTGEALTWRAGGCHCGAVRFEALTADEVEHIFRATGDYEAYRLAIDLEKQTVSDDFGWTAHFEIEPFDKKCLLEGLDDIALTLAHEDRIEAYEKGHPLPHRFE